MIGTEQPPGAGRIVRLKRGGTGGSEGDGWVQSPRGQGMRFVTTTRKKAEIKYGSMFNS